MPLVLQINLPVEDAEELAALAGAGLAIGQTAPAALSALRLELAKARRMDLAGLIARRDPDPLRTWLDDRGKSGELTSPRPDPYLVGSAA